MPTLWILTYGYTALHRMAYNNLANGGRVLVEMALWHACTQEAVARLSVALGVEETVAREAPYR